MSWTLEEFAAACQRALTAEPGPAGREKVRAIVQDVLKDQAFVARHVGDDVPERKLLYEDPKLGFCILAHSYPGAKESNPHDHGPSWAIYGQAVGESVRSAGPRRGPAGGARRGRLRPPPTHTLKPGMPPVSKAGDLHSPRRDGPTRLIRIEGTNMEKVRRLAFERA